MGNTTEIVFSREAVACRMGERADSEPEMPSA